MMWVSCACVALFAVGLSGCSGGAGSLDGGCVTNCGPLDGGNGPFKIYTIDPKTYAVGQASVPLFQMAVKPGVGDVIGVAYTEQESQAVSAVAKASGGLVKDYDVMYVEFDAQTQTATQPQKIALVQRQVGVSLDFQPNGEPAVAYLGFLGAESDPSQAFWFQNDGVIAFRSGGSSWTSQVTAVSTGDQAIAGNPPSDAPATVVGLYPALLFENGSPMLVYRDVHTGQSAGTGDYQSSDMELAVLGSGTNPSVTSRLVIQEGGNYKNGWGAHNRIIHGLDGGPALISDRSISGPDTFGEDVVFSERVAANTWQTRSITATTAGSVPFPPFSNSPANTQAGPQIGYDPTEGYAVAYMDRSVGTLKYSNCQTNCSDPTVNHWSTPDPVFGSGSGGWYPSVAVNPTTHAPSIAFYICSNQSGKNEGSCDPTQDELDITERLVPGGAWTSPTTVDLAGAFQTQMKYLPSGKRAIAYRDPVTGVLKLAVENLP